MYKKIIFKNGLRLILVPQPSSLTSAVLVLVEAGSEYEKKHQNGISHFLEHMCFKGTTNRPRPGTISTELDSLGAEYNAFTGQEYTGYWAKVESHKLPRALDIVSDLYAHPIFNPDEIEKERGVVIEEINMYEDTPMRRVQELFMGLLYGDQPAGWDIGGRKEVIRRLKREDFIKYRGEHYVAPATTLIVAGAFKEKDVLSKVKSVFGHLPRERKTKRLKTKELQGKPHTLVRFKKTDQSHLVIGLRACDIFDKRRYALQVLADVLGGGMSSRLFRRVREELGAAYYVRASTDLFLDHGFLSVSVGPDSKRILEIVKAVLHEIKRFKTELVPPKELQKAKDHLVGNFIMSLETPDELASYYGGQEILTKKLVQPKEIVRQIRKVKAEDLRKIAKQFFVNKGLNLAVIGPYKSAKPFKKALGL